MRKRLLALIVPLAAVAGLVGPAVTTASAETTPNTVLFQDEFNTVDNSTWLKCFHWRLVACSNGPTDRQAYLPANVTAANGVLSLTAKKETTQGWLADGSTMSFPYSSGMITTHDSFSFLYGYAEFRARIPKGRGLWPALWLLPRDNTWPPEIDIMENVGDNTSWVFFTNHSVDGPNQVISAQAPDFSTDFHTYGVDWQPGRITYYVDGVAKGSITERVPTKPMYLVANLGVGGPWPGDPDSATVFPATFDLDWVRVLAHAPEAGAPAPTPTTSTTIAPVVTVPTTEPAPTTTTTPVVSGGGGGGGTVTTPTTVAPPVNAPSPTTTTTVPVPTQPTGRFKEKFNHKLDRKQWPVVGGDATAAYGRGVLRALHSYTVVRSDQTYALDAAGVGVEVPVVASGNSGETFLTVGKDERNELAIIKSGRNIVFRAIVNGTTTVAGAMPYNAAQHRWWRIRQSGGFVLWDTSRDGKTWTARRALKVPMALDHLFVQLRAGTYDRREAQGSAVFDNLNVPPGS